MNERIAKVIARSGVCSRRDAEKLITSGQVTLNGQTIMSPAQNVGPTDKITVRGTPLHQAERTRVWLLHKPAGVVTTHKDPQDRKTVFTLLPPSMPRVMSVGRLDLNSEGLLLLTNDGALVRKLEHPSSNLKRTYLVRVLGTPDPERLKALRQGITVDGVTYGRINARIDRQGQSNAWLVFELFEGKNREIRNVCRELGLRVNRLKRIQYGPFELGHLEIGKVKEIHADDLVHLLEGLKVA